MKVYHFDIWGGDKGIIFAPNRKEANALFKKEYPNVKFGFDDGKCKIEDLDNVPAYSQLWVTEPY